MKKVIKTIGLFLLMLLAGFKVNEYLNVTAHAETTGNSYYVANYGSDYGAGTIDDPFASIMKAQEVAEYGDTVYIRGGKYTDFDIAESNNLYNYVHKIYKSGITYRGYEGETPVFDFSNVPTNRRVAAFYITSKASDVTIDSIEVVNIKVGEQKQSEGFRVEGKNITLNRVSVHDTQAVGIYYTGHGTGTVYRCDSYNNIGIGVSLGNCDGFGAHGDGVKFIECRAWNNSDDGYDCIDSKGANTFDSCWAFDMNAGGDSNGFKIGGWGKHAITFIPPVHTVNNCIAAANGAHGFYSNHQPGQAATWTNNTAYKNKKGNFYMLECATIDNPTDVPGTREILYNNLSYKNNSLDSAEIPDENNTNNSWNIKNVTMSDKDFKSLDMKQLSKTRGQDGELPKITFMKTTNKSKFKGLGASLK